MSLTKFIFEQNGISHIRESTTGASFPLHTQDLKDLLGDTSRSSSNLLRLAKKLGIYPQREIKGFRGAREFSDEQVLKIARASKCQIIDNSKLSKNIIILGPTSASAIIPRKSN